MLNKLAGYFGLSCLLTFAGVASAQTDLSAIQSYLLAKTGTLAEQTAELDRLSGRYYALAESEAFDYAALWQKHEGKVAALIKNVRDVWTAASPLYEQVEGIVAGTPSLAQFDVDLDAGSSAAEDPQNAVSFDIALPNGQVLERPGNLFGVTESTLWGTFAAYSSGVKADLDGNGKLEFGEVLPDANVLKGASALLAQKAAELKAAGTAWNPTEQDAFTALAVMVPTMSEYFASWRDSRFVVGAASEQRDFVAISRLADIQDILSGLEVVLASVTPRIATVDAAQGEQIEAQLLGLKAHVADIYTAERAGKRFSPEQADVLGAEAQDRATAITGQVVQVAGALGVTVAD